MTPRLVKSALFATGVHTLLLMPWVSSIRVDRWAGTDVMRGVSSVELELVSPPSLEEGEDSLPPTGAQQPLWVDDRGALESPEVGPLKNPAPRYPWAARLRGWEGTALLWVWVDSVGRVEQVQLRRSSGYEALDDAARRAVQQWCFRPAVRAGVPVGSQVELPITFRLRKGESS